MIKINLEKASTDYLWEVFKKIWLEISFRYGKKCIIELSKDDWIEEIKTGEKIEEYILIPYQKTKKFFVLKDGEYVLHKGKQKKVIKVKNGKILKPSAGIVSTCRRFFYFTISRNSGDGERREK